MDFGGGDDIVFEQKGKAGIVTLNRPKALNAINQGTEIWAGAPVILWKLLLTYFVPFAVASYGSYAALRSSG